VHQGKWTKSTCDFTGKQFTQLRAKSQLSRIGDGPAKTEGNRRLQSVTGNSPITHTDFGAQFHSLENKPANRRNAGAFTANQVQRDRFEG
jgi:hypothetical protein